MTFSPDRYYVIFTVNLKYLGDKVHGDSPIAAHPCSQLEVKR